MSSPESLLAEKLATYRGKFDQACRGLFESGESVTLEYEHDDEEDAVDVTAAPIARVSDIPFKISNAGSKVKDELRRAVRSIAEDFAHEFNAKLSAAAQSDPTVAMVADKYEMGSPHVDELEELLAAPIARLLAKLDAGDLDGARRATLEAWPLLEKRIRAKWQAYFVLTFQDVSVERKAARDRRKLQPRFDPGAADSFRAPVVAPPRGRSPWIAVVALLLLAAASGWFLMRGHGHHATAALSNAPAR